MKILVIDDWRIIAEGIRARFPDAKVDHVYRIPESDDQCDLSEYDILFVDNEGIGNRIHKSGQDFLKHYRPKNPNQVVIYHSGLGAYGEFKEFLDSQGFYSFTKGDNPDELVQLVIENFKGVENEVKT